MGGKKFTWGDLLSIVQNLPAESALQRAMAGPEESPWTLGNHLLADVADTLHLLWWAKTEDATRRRNRPKPIPRPGIEDDSKKQIGRGSLAIEDMKSWLGGDFVNLN